MLMSILSSVVWSRQIEGRFSNRRKCSNLPSETKASYVPRHALPMSRQRLTLRRLLKARSTKTLAGESVWPVSTRVMTDTRVATGFEVYSKEETPERTAFFLRMMLISCL